MHGGDGKVPHAALEAHIQDGTVYVHSVGVGTVQQDHLLAVFGAGVHQVAHRNIIGIETEADVLDVHDEDVEHLHRFLGGMVAAGSAIQREDGNAREGLYAVGHVGAVIGQVPEAVLRGEDGAHVDALCDEGVQDVGFGIAHQARLVGEDGYALSFQKGHIDIELFVSQDDALFTFGAGNAQEAAEKEDGGRHPAKMVFHGLVNGLVMRS